VKLRTGDPWMPSPEYSKTLAGLTVNLLTAHIERALQFQRDVLGCDIVYSDPDFIVVSGYGAGWTFHADHTYSNHPFGAHTVASAVRGRGVELRVHGCDPDRAEAAAHTLGFVVLSPPTDKGHGLREAHLVDADGYTWVPDRLVQR
jgi:catechol 2,3-dioxygenase-like lactoylglutathione lyase family enzyme